MSDFSGNIDKIQAFFNTPFKAPTPTTPAPASLAIPEPSVNLSSDVSPKKKKSTVFDRLDELKTTKSIYSQLELNKIETDLRAELQNNPETKDDTRFTDQLTAGIAHAHKVAANALITKLHANKDTLTPDEIERMHKEVNRRVAKSDIKQDKSFRKRLGSAIRFAHEGSVQAHMRLLKALEPSDASPIETHAEAIKALYTARDMGVPATLRRELTDEKDKAYGRLAESRIASFAKLDPACGIEIITDLQKETTGYIDKSEESKKPYTSKYIDLFCAAHRAHLLAARHKVLQLQTTEAICNKGTIEEWKNEILAHIKEAKEEPNFDNTDSKIVLAEIRLHGIAAKGKTEMLEQAACYSVQHIGKLFAEIQEHLKLENNTPNKQRIAQASAAFRDAHMSSANVLLKKMAEVSSSRSPKEIEKLASDIHTHIDLACDKTHESAACLKKTWHEKLAEQKITSLAKAEAATNKVAPAMKDTTLVKRAKEIRRAVRRSLFRDTAFATTHHTYSMVKALYIEATRIYERKQEQIQARKEAALQSKVVVTKAAQNGAKSVRPRLGADGRREKKREEKRNAAQFG